MNKMIIVRRATRHDLAEILAVQENAYAAPLVEDARIFQDILEYSMSYVAVTGDGDGEKIVGFVLGHPSTLNQIHLLHQIVVPVFEKDVYFIHDLSVLEEYRGAGVGSLLAQRFIRDACVAGGEVIIQCISVNGSERFWRKQGFEVTAGVVLSPLVKECYGGGDCVHMSAYT